MGGQCPAAPALRGHTYYFANTENAKTRIAITSPKRKRGRPHSSLALFEVARRRIVRDL
jgi:hypothetical protein